jgi:hypothetical protein
MKKIVSVILIAAAFFGSLLVAPSQATYADAFNAACEVPGLTEAQKKEAGCFSGDEKAEGEKPGQIVQYIVGIIVGLTGSVALVFIIIGGIHYMTATGDATKLKKAKETIMYAVIGLVISALAFAITNWVISILP